MNMGEIDIKPVGDEWSLIKVQYCGSKVIVLGQPDK